LTRVSYYITWFEKIITKGEEERDIRVVAELTRYLLKYAGIEFNDKRYEFGERTTIQDGMPSLVPKCLLFQCVFWSNVFISNTSSVPMRHLVQKLIIKYVPYNSIIDLTIEQLLTEY
jgi:hypothetical protein